jgi:hypothetical protein
VKKAYNPGSNALKAGAFMICQRAGNPGDRISFSSFYPSGFNPSADTLIFPVRCNFTTNPPCPHPFLNFRIILVVGYQNFFQ